MGGRAGGGRLQPLLHLRSKIHKLEYKTEEKRKEKILTRFSFED